MEKLKSFLEDFRGFKDKGSYFKFISTKFFNKKKYRTSNRIN